MNCDVEEIFGTIADHIPTSEDTEFVFSAEVLPQPPPLLETNQLVIRKGERTSYSYTVNRVDALHFQAHKRTYRVFGLLFLARVFHSELPEIHIRLTHAESDIHEIILDYRIGTWPLIPEYQTRPDKFTYWPEAAEKYRHSILRIPDQFLPRLSLTDASKVPDTQTSEWAARDILRCAGSDCGNVLFANVLLNLSRPEEIAQEFTLEGEFGFGGVGRGSAEVTLWLPGSDGWHVKL